MQRAAIVTLHKDAQPRSEVAHKINTSLPTVRHWIKQFEEKKEVNDSPRSGRPRCTDESLDTAIVGESYNDPFASPRQLKARLELEGLSDDTIARRLNEAGLHARIARREFKLTDEHKRKRLSFAEGYQRWSDDDWCTVIFADEKLFWGEGHSGRVFVRRPDGT